MKMVSPVTPMMRVKMSLVKTMVNVSKKRVLIDVNAWMVTMVFIAKNNIDDCDPNPCQNDGTCIDGVNAYTCTCISGYTGVNCEINIDDCDPSPCQNAGVCVDGIDAYTCTCPTGFTGVDWRLTLMIAIRIPA